MAPPSYVCRGEKLGRLECQVNLSRPRWRRAASSAAVDARQLGVSVAMARTSSSDSCAQAL